MFFCFYRGRLTTYPAGTGVVVYNAGRFSGKPNTFFLVVYFETDTRSSSGRRLFQIEFLYRKKSNTPSHQQI